MEIMLAFSLFILFTLSTFILSRSMQELKIWSLKELDKMEKLVFEIDSGIGLNKIVYGNDSSILSNDLYRISESDYVGAWGRNSCDVRIKFDQSKIDYSSTGIDMGLSNPSTDIEVRNSIVYLTADSATASRSDFFIIDAEDIFHPNVISSLNIGPGLSALEVAGPYVFAAQASTVNQLQIIDIHDRFFPQLISELKLSLPTPTTTAPFASSIFYSRGYVYLGTAKWNGAEFAIIDVSNIISPKVVGSFETNTLINDIYVRGDKAYLATSDEKQMRVLDVSDKTQPILIDSFSPTGWQTQEGKTLDYFEETLGFGRTVGGFNVTGNHELFISSTTTISRDIPGGVYGILMRPPYIFLLTHASGKEFQVFDSTLSTKVFEFPLQSSPVRMTCDGSTFYFATGDSKGISILKSNE
ncbi:MAG: hypothetical protein Q7S72_02055 [Candidatus Taylorbacteria bacterium]|nr:hypothetical protein [Candidatus Taylorbacteria bacterium]